MILPFGVNVNTQLKIYQTQKTWNTAVNQLNVRPQFVHQTDGGHLVTGQHRLLQVLKLREESNRFWQPPDVSLTA